MTPLPPKLPFIHKYLIYNIVLLFKRFLTSFRNDSSWRKHKGEEAVICRKQISSTIIQAQIAASSPLLQKYHVIPSGARNLFQRIDIQSK